MPIEVTPRAIEVLRRALDAGRMDPAVVGMRLTLDRSGALRTGFSEQPEQGDTTVTVGGMRLFVPAQIASRGAVLDVADEHDRLVLSG